MYRVSFDELPWEECGNGIRHKRIRVENRWLRLVQYFADMEPHTCDRGHLGQILQGRMEIAFPLETIVFAPGDGVTIPAGPQHRHVARVLGDPVTALFVEDV